MSQEQNILSHLQKRSITPLDAFTLYGCMRLAARIRDLKAKGHNIITTIEKQGGKKFARYTLLRSKR